MPLVSMRTILEEARQRKYAVGYFESWDLPSLETVLEAAEEMASPVIMGFGCSMANQNWLNNGGLEYLAALGRIAASQAKVPASFILNETLDFQQVEMGIKYGFNAVMMDTSHLPFEKNLEFTRKIVEIAHPADVCVEGELGRLPDASGSSKSSLTDPEQAAQFVEETNVDALAVSIGNVHCLTEGEALIDFDRLRQIKKVVRIPLVIHGGTGFPKDSVRKVIELGVAKFNVGTVLKNSFLEGIKERLQEAPGDLDVHKIIGSRRGEDLFTLGREQVKEVIKSLLQLYGSVSKA